MRTRLVFAETVTFYIHAYMSSTYVHMIRQYVLVIPQKSMVSLLLHETEAQPRSNVNNKDTIQVNGV